MGNVVFSQEAYSGLESLGFGHTDINSVLSKSPTLVKQLNQHYIKGGSIELSDKYNQFAYETGREYCLY